MRSLLLSFIPSSAHFWPNSYRIPTQSGAHNIAACRLIRTEPQMKLIRGVSQIVDKYDAILLDQFGVIHNGQTPYPRALEAIRKLRENGLKIVILSNSSRQSKHARQKLTRMGVDIENIHGIITSGQLAFGAIREEMARSPEFRVLHFNWSAERGTISTQDHNIRSLPPMTRAVEDMRFPSPQDVDMIVAHGTDGIMTSQTAIQPLPVKALQDLCIEIAQQKPDLPFYCANPDMVTVDGSNLRVMPGTLAKDFEDSGGKYVRRLGKPDTVAYDAAMQLIGDSDKHRVLAIGDSLAHDILGAANAGIDSLYIAGGINAVHFRIDPMDGFKDTDCAWQWEEAILDGLQKEEAPQLGERKPTYVSPFFRW